jgi:hypothetical protein
VLRKLLKFHHDHRTTSEQLWPQLETAAEQLTQPARERAGELLSAALTGPTRRRGPSSLADLWPLILRKYGVRITRHSAAGRSACVPSASGSTSVSSIPSALVPGAASDATNTITLAPVGTAASNGSIPV